MTPSYTISFPIKSAIGHMKGFINLQKMFSSMTSLARYQGYIMKSVFTTIIQITCRDQNRHKSGILQSFSQKNEEMILCNSSSSLKVKSHLCKFNGKLTISSYSYNIKGSTQFQPYLVRVLEKGILGSLTLTFCKVVNQNSQPQTPQQISLPLGQVGPSLLL